jgi:hypothetical protein
MILLVILGPCLFNLPCGLLICAYRAPKQPVEPFIDYLDDVTREALRLDKQIIIIGDLNCDYLDESAPQTTALKEFLNVYKLTQLIREPTRSTASESLIDLLVITSPQLFWSTGVLQYWNLKFQLKFCFGLQSKCSWLNH